MKNLLIATLLCLTGMTTLAQVTQVDTCWVPWECESPDTSKSLTVGHKRFIMRYESPWTEGERMVSYSRPGAMGTEWITYQIVGPGIHTLDVTYDDPWPSNYFEMWETSLRFVDTNTGDTLVSTPLSVTTEPSPNLYASYAPSPPDSVKFVVATSSLPGGWGANPPCPEGMEAYIDAVVAQPWGDTLFVVDSIPCILGQVVLATFGFPYQGPEIDICIQATLKRMVPGSQPYTVVQSDVSCETIGGITTSLGEQRADEQVLIVGPNPFADALQIKTKGAWEIRTANGQLLQKGNGPETINTGAWSPGIYLVRSGEIVQRLLRE